MIRSISHFAWAIAILVCFAPIAAIGQDSTTPDTLDWKGYLPLQVGNVWEYSYWSPGGVDRTYFLRRHIVRDTTIRGQSYLVMEEFVFNDFTLGKPYVEAPQVYLLRYDDSLRAVVQWEKSGQRNKPYPRYVCNLGAAFASRICTEHIFDGLQVSGGYAPTYGGLTDIDSGAARKRFSDNCCGGFYQFEYGIGLTKWREPGGVRDKSVYFARVAGNSFGACKICSIWRASPRPPEEEKPRPPFGWQMTLESMHPMPFGDELKVEVHAPGPFSLEIFDVVGRKIATSDHLGSEWPTPSLVRMDTSDWTAGVYMIHLSDLSGRRIVKTAVLVR